MITFKSPQDLQKLPPENSAHLAIKDLVGNLIAPHPSYNADEEGYIVLIEESDVDRVLSEIWDDWRLVDIPWEGITLRDGVFLAVFLANNEFGIVFVIPNAEWVNGTLREVIEYHLDP